MITFHLLTSATKFSLFGLERINILNTMTLFNLFGTGTDSRSTPQQLSSRLAAVNAHWIQHSSCCDVVENYEMEVDEDVGNLLAIIVSIRHRQLVEHWYLAKVYVVSLGNGNEQQQVHRFPCNSIVLTRVTLRTGEGKSSSS